MSRIVKLEISNFKRIRAVTIEPKGSVVTVRGRNGQGKSSCLDAVAALFGGEKLCPREPIRRGEKEALVRARVDRYAEFGEVIAERRFRLTESGETTSTLKLYRDDGLKLDKPQRRLDELIGALSWDPLAFLQLPAREQAETLRKLSGVDFSLLDGQRRAAYDDRAAANRQVAQLTARLSAMPAVEAPDELVSAADLLADQEQRRSLADMNEAKRRTLQFARQDYQRATEKVNATAARIRELESQLEAARTQHRAEVEAEARLKEEGLKLRAYVEQLRDPDLEEIPLRVRELEVTNDRVRQKKARAALVQDLEQAELEAKELDDDITAIDQQKAEALANAKLPVVGLSFDEEGVTFNGLSLDQASQAEQLRVSVAIGAALAPTLRAMLVRDASLLDEDSLALLRQEAELADLQLFLETVARDGDGEGVLIEDGLVEDATQP